ncbi:MAG: FHA domain-containing protein [Myxococcota bacterium]|jgi:pSer/pThr/pTyr-binding forkhead associated (FHA) protein|nr:FHA domain-containing protein [Myxococcota bacterium]
MITCHKCGRKIEDRYKFCLSCGAPLSAQSSQASVPPVASAAADSAEARPASDARALEPVSASVVNVSAPLIKSSEGSASSRPSGVAGSLRQMPSAGAMEEATIPDRRAQRSSEPELVGSPTLDELARADQSESTDGPRICRKCNTELPPNFLFCGRCGERYVLSGPDFATAAHVAVPANTETTSPVRGRLVLIHPDGSEGESVALIDGENILGSSSVTVLSESDFVSPQHCRVNCAQGHITIEDLGSLNGVYLRLANDPVVLLHGDQIRIGQEVFRYVDWERRVPIAQSGDDTLLQGGPAVDAWGALELLHAPGQVSNVYVLTDDEQVIGREMGQIVLRDDGFISGQHACLRPSPTGVTIQDLDSSNGTYVRLRRPYRAKDGDFLQIGEQLFLLHARA